MPTRWPAAAPPPTRNAALASARSEFSSVEAARDVARGGLLPQVNASGSAVHNEQFESQGSARGAGTGLCAGAGTHDVMPSLVFGVTGNTL